MRPDHVEANAVLGERRLQVAEIRDHVLPAWLSSVVTTMGTVVRV